jgi:hypothetical protein
VLSSCGVAILPPLTVIYYTKLKFFLGRETVNSLRLNHYPAHLLHSLSGNTPSKSPHLNSYKCILADHCQSRDSTVGIATGYGLDDQGVRVRVPTGGNNFHSSMSSRPALGATQPQPPIQWVLGLLSQGVNQPRREADHSPQLVPRSRKRGSMQPLPHISSCRTA